MEREEYYDALGVEPMDTSDEERLEEETTLKSIIRSRQRRRLECVHPALMRWQTDQASYRPLAAIRLAPRADDPWTLLVWAHPSSGYYSSALSNLSHAFEVRVGPEYPFEPPVVRCVGSSPYLHHPNVDPCSGVVSMDLLGLEWTPVVSLSGVLDSLVGILEDPVTVGTSVVNSEAATQLLTQPTALVAALTSLALLRAHQRSWGHQDLDPLPLSSFDPLDEDRCPSASKKRSHLSADDSSVFPLPKRLIMESQNDAQNNHCNNNNKMAHIY